MFKSLFEYSKRRELLKRIIISKLVSEQKDLMLGYLWWILEPLLLTCIYWLLVQIILKSGMPNYPLFVLCGLVPYRVFAQSFSQSVNSVTAKFSLISQLNFPRIFLPLADVLANHVKLFFGLMVIIFVARLHGIPLNGKLFFLIVPFLSQMIFLCGVGMVSSVLGVYVRDLRNLVQFVTRIFMYMSPVLYSIDRIPERFQDYYLLNPVAALIHSYRGIVMYDTLPSMRLVTILFIESLIIFFLGYLCFSKQEKDLLKAI